MRRLKRSLAARSLLFTVRTDVEPQLTYRFKVGRVVLHKYARGDGGQHGAEALPRRAPRPSPLHAAVLAREAPGVLVDAVRGPWCEAVPQRFAAFALEVPGKSPRCVATRGNSGSRQRRILQKIRRRTVISNPSVPNLFGRLFRAVAVPTIDRAARREDARADGVPALDPPHQRILRLPRLAIGRPLLTLELSWEVWPCLRCVFTRHFKLTANFPFMKFCLG